MKILLVDDSETSLMLLETILHGAGYHDLVRTNAATEALEFLHLAKKESPETQPPIDLILMDIVMPGLNGIEATRAIKNDPQLRDVPIIMVTVKDEEDSLERAFEAGAIDYINKPVSKIELRARVGSVLKLKQEMDQRKARERQLENLTRRLHELSNLDGLTNVANRRSFEDTYGREWRRSKREKKPLSVMMIDIDFFKRYNDTYGHLEGDTCLKQVAQAIQSSIRRPGDFIARYGGEEFVVILPDTSPTGAVTIAEAIRNNVGALHIEHSASDVSDVVTVSIGIAGHTPDDSIDSKTLLSSSDQALYQAKSMGRDRINIHTPGSCSF
ncbi:GGDEF domain-containing response regulator [Desulfovibrio inopinatus]|uniref:GGDEF domain-containing response regulator n=1 Tax=Desulfovibrio inopinatus TaxID=102109 RepID=UPI0004014483|nr:diguanylate cyclase [Desulfovibrio inopinatus]